MPVPDERGIRLGKLFQDWPIYETPVCPYCEATSGHSVIWSVPNAVRLVLNSIVLTFDMLIFPVFINLGMPLSFKRRCGACRAKFIVKDRLPKDPRCGNCDYDLTGNVSGRCPECGWRITRKVNLKVRAKRRRERRHRGDG